MTPRSPKKSSAVTNTNAPSAGTNGVFVVSTNTAGVVTTNEIPPGTQITADSLEYLQDKKLMIGTGHCVVRQGADSLSADYMTYQSETQDVFARGNVVYNSKGRVWQGQQLTYNMKTRQGDFGEFTASVPPYMITAKDSKRISTNEYLLKDVTITTCSGDHPEYLLHAREARLVDGTHLKATGVIFNYRGVPIFYLPRLSRDLASHDAWMEVVPGYSSRSGLFLLGAYNYKMGREVLGTTHLDYRTSRGPAVGQDFAWKGTNGLWNGEFKSYYMDDSQPFKNADEQAQFSPVEDSTRYRLKLSDFHTLSDRDYITTELNYLSDPNILKDFFSGEYSDSTFPENRISLTHRGDGYSAGLVLNKRLNDFYDNVNRVPEATYDLQRTEIGQSPIYYETENSASELEKVYSETNKAATGVQDYSAFRVDSTHLFLYPMREFDFLSVIPRAGYEGTYYSSTFQSNTVVTTALSTDTNGVTTVTTNTTTSLVKGGADVRNVYQLGLETSFKAYRTWDDVIVLGDGDGFRHIAEPFANYTYIPKPNLRPYDVPQFDSVDTIDERSDVQFGIRNKFQTRRQGSVRDLMDFNIYTTYLFYKNPGDEDFSDIAFDNELRIWDNFPIDFDGTYNQYNNEFDTFNTQFSYVNTDLSSASVEYRYAKDIQSQLATEFVLLPNSTWSLQLYGRFDLDNRRVDEHEYFLQHKTDCLGYGIGFRQTDNDYQIWIRLFLLAFPESNIELGQ